MRLILIAPVANRAWIIPHWMAALAGQTRRPDRLLLLHGGTPGDDTWAALHREAQRHRLPLHVRHDHARTHPRENNQRFTTLARLRNQLLTWAAADRADLILSLDTDILLHDPETIVRLEEQVLAGDCDLAAPIAFLHPGAPAAWEPEQTPCWAYNFGYLPDGPAGPTRPWQRPHVNDLPWGQRLRMDVPMAVWLANQRALGCRYAWHESGEDIGYAQDLQAHGVRCLVDTSLYAQHVWSPDHLTVPAAP